MGDLQSRPLSKNRKVLLMELFKNAIPAILPGEKAPLNSLRLTSG